jgi:hypothetical protein
MDFLVYYVGLMTIGAGMCYAGFFLIDMLWAMLG